MVVTRGVLACLLLVPVCGYAQSNTTDRGISVIPEAPAEKPTVVVPEVPPAGRVPPALPDSIDSGRVLEGYGAKSRTADVRVTRIVVTGNTVLPPAAIEAVTARYANRTLSVEQIEALRRELTTLYVDRGYVSSGMLLGDQEVGPDGVLHLHAIEGRLEAVRLTGNRLLPTPYIEARLREPLGPVLNVHEVEESLRLMQTWPLVRQINAEVLPGSARGLGALDVDVHENPPLSLTIGADNHRSPSVGEYEGVVTLVDGSLTHHGDVLNTSFEYSKGLHDGYVSYALPLSARDLTLEGHYVRSTSDIVEAPFETLDIISRTETEGVRLSQPFARTLTQVAAIGLELERKSSRSTLLGVPFSFAPGEIDGKAAVTAARLVFDWSRRYASDALAVRGTVSRGIGWFGATDNAGRPGGLPDSHFTSFLLQSQYAHQFDWRRTQLIARLTDQQSSRPLLSVEKLAIGGASTVRGFRENLLVRDQGVIASAELRVPPIVDENGAPRYGLALAPFVDYGRGRDRLTGLPSSQSKELLGAGPGVRWDAWGHVHAEVYYGLRITGPAATGSSLQDHGLHFLATSGWTF